MSLKKHACVICRHDLSLLIPRPKPPSARDTLSRVFFRPVYDDMYVDALLRLHARERQRVSRVGNHGAEVTLIHAADSDDDERHITE